jgi:hypothetical protein
LSDSLDEPVEQMDNDPRADPAGRGKKEAQDILAGALRAVRGWLEPWIMLRRYWRAFCGMPPPQELRALLDRVFSGRGLYLYVR